MTNTLIASYLGFGLAANRPASPSVDAGAIAFYYATDTTTLSQWTGSAWAMVGGGYVAGSAPTVVQSANNVNGGQGVTLGAAPTNGNLLVAMTFNPSVVSAGTGWTLIANNSTGTDTGAIFTKTAGAGESTTQNPLNSAPGTGTMVVWEINGQNGTPLVYWSTEAEQSNPYAPSVVIGPLDQKLLFLGAISLISSSQNFVNMYGVVQDQFVKTGSSRQIAAGHASLKNFPIAQIAATISGTANFKATGLIITG